MDKKKGNNRKKAEREEDIGAKQKVNINEKPRFTYITDDFSSMFGSNNRDSVSLQVVALSEHLLNTFPV